MIPYRKFTDTFKNSVGEPTPPKSPKAPKVVLATNLECQSLGGLGGLGGLGVEQSQTRNIEPPPATWTDAQEERTAIVEYDGGASRAWAEALARLDLSKPPGEVPEKRWQRFIDDCGRFLDAGWADKAVALGWGPLDLFGADRERPFARIDHMGLLWLCKGGTIIELYRDRAVLKTQSGTRQTYRRRPVEVGRVVLAWDADAET